MREFHAANPLPGWQPTKRSKRSDVGVLELREIEPTRGYSKLIEPSASYGKAVKAAIQVGLQTGAIREKGRKSNSPGIGENDGV